MGRVTCVTVSLIFVLSGCSKFDDNSKPVYGETFGLPVNCRAFVQASIDGYREKRFTADEAMAGLERNCGINGHAWIDNR